MQEEDNTSPENGLSSTGTKRTPLPKFQLFILFLIQFTEPVTATVIYPFVIQFVRDTGVTGGEEQKIGYFAGIIVSRFRYLDLYNYFDLSSGIRIFYCRSINRPSLGLGI